MRSVASFSETPTDLRLEQGLSSAQTRLAQALMDTRNGDGEAFRLLYSLTRARLFGICVGICRDRWAAEDVLAETYLAVWKKAGAWDPARGSAMSWLTAVAKNQAIDCHRARLALRLEPIGDGWDLVDDSPDVERLLLSAERDTLIQRCLAALLPDQKAAIKAIYFEGLPYAKLSKREGVPLSTLKSRVRRGLATIKVSLSIDA